jgi:hypothetical protein
MKSAVLSFTLVVLVAFELYLATAYLPLRCQKSIGNVVSHTLFRQEVKPLITHPALDEEIERTLQQSLPLVVALYAFITTLVVFNGFLILKIWTALDRKPKQVSGMN